MFWVYMIKNNRGNLYVGVTQNPSKRLFDHNHKRGALFTKTNQSFQIIFLEGHSNLAQARKREIQIKKWRRDKKEMLIKRYSQGLETKR